MLQDFQSVSDHFTTLESKGLILGYSLASTMTGFVFMNCLYSQVHLHQNNSCGYFS